MQETIRKVIVTIDGGNLEINAIRVFRGMNPTTGRCSVIMMDADSEKWLWLFWLEQEEAGILVQKIQEGEITDLTGYHAEWR